MINIGAERLDRGVLELLGAAGVVGAAPKPAPSPAPMKPAKATPPEPNFSLDEIFELAKSLERARDAKDLGRAKPFIEAAIWELQRRTGMIREWRRRHFRGKVG